MYYLRKVITLPQPNTHSLSLENPFSIFPNKTKQNDQGLLQKIISEYYFNKFCFMKYPSIALIFSYFSLNMFAMCNHLVVTKTVFIMAIMQVRKSRFDVIRFG